MLKALDPHHEDYITFQEFMILMQNVENKMARADPNNLLRKEF
jgi:Ca2+-binding EF-hand superfamily protein